MKDDDDNYDNKLIMMKIKDGDDDYYKIKDNESLIMTIMKMS